MHYVFGSIVLQMTDTQLSLYLFIFLTHFVLYVFRIYLEYIGLICSKIFFFFFFKIVLSLSSSVQARILKSTATEYDES